MRSPRLNPQPKLAIAYILMIHGGQHQHRSAISSFAELLGSLLCIGVTTDSCMEKARLTIRRRHDGHSLVCVSDEPVLTCGPSCPTADSWAPANVCFTCCRQHDQPITVYRTPPSYSDRYFTGEGQACPDYQQRIDVPITCTAA